MSWVYPRPVGSSGKSDFIDVRSCAGDTLGEKFLSALQKVKELGYPCKIYCPAGSYYFSGQISIESDVEIIGDGATTIFTGGSMLPGQQRQAYIGGLWTFNTEFDYGWDNIEISQDRTQITCMGDMFPIDFPCKEGDVIVIHSEDLINPFVVRRVVDFSNRIVSLDEPLPVVSDFYVEFSKFSGWSLEQRVPFSIKFKNCKFTGLKWGFCNLENIKFEECYFDEGVPVWITNSKVEFNSCYGLEKIDCTNAFPDEGNYVRITCCPEVVVKNCRTGFRMFGNRHCYFENIDFACSGSDPNNVKGLLYGCEDVLIKNLTRIKMEDFKTLSFVFCLDVKIDGWKDNILNHILGIEANGARGGYIKNSVISKLQGTMAGFRNMVIEDTRLGSAIIDLLNSGYLKIVKSDIQGQLVLGNDAIVSECYFTNQNEFINSLVLDGENCVVQNNVFEDSQSNEYYSIVVGWSGNNSSVCNNVLKQRTILVEGSPTGVVIANNRIPSPVVDPNEVSYQFNNYIPEF